jgi:hypothetical protein
MKKSELKSILKPLVKQCVKEALLEEGILSNVISEVIAGLRPLLGESQRSFVSESELRSDAHEEALLEQQRAEFSEEKRRMLKEHKRKVLDAAGFGTEIFEGVEPLSTGGALNETPSHSPLSGVDPGDPGVDISGIMALSNTKWNKLI